GEHGMRLRPGLSARTADAGRAVCFSAPAARGNPGTPPGRCRGAPKTAGLNPRRYGLVCPGVATPERKIIRVRHGSPFHRCRLKHLVGNATAPPIGYRLPAGSEVQP